MLRWGIFTDLVDRGSIGPGLDVKTPIGVDVDVQYVGMRLALRVRERPPIGRCRLVVSRNRNPVCAGFDAHSDLPDSQLRGHAILVRERLFWRCRVEIRDIDCDLTRRICEIIQPESGALGTGVRIVFTVNRRRGVAIRSFGHPDGASRLSIDEVGRERAPMANCPARRRGDLTGDQNVIAPRRPQMKSAITVNLRIRILLRQGGGRVLGGKLNDGGLGDVRGLVGVRRCCEWPPQSTAPSHHQH